MAATETERQAFAVELKRRRRRTGMTQREVALALADRQVTVTDRAVSGWERGAFAPDRATTQALDSMLGAGGDLMAALGYAAERQEQAISVSSADGVDFDELRRLDPEGWEHVMATARMLRDRARENR